MTCASRARSASRSASVVSRPLPGGRPRRFAPPAARRPSEGFYARAQKSAILLVCSLITRPYVLDLLDARSVVRRLLGDGLDVWLLDWGTPGADDAAHGLARYALGVLPRMAEVARRAA